MADDPKTILIVEDEKALLKALDEIITEAGFKTLTAENGKQALATAIKEQPDLILLDILLPQMDGLKVLEKLRKDKWGKGAEVILLTNLNDTKTIADAMSFGVHNYLVKSDIDVTKVISKIKERLKV